MKLEAAVSLLVVMAVSGACLAGSAGLLLSHPGVKLSIADLLGSLNTVVVGAFAPDDDEAGPVAVGRTGGGSTAQVRGIPAPAYSLAANTSGREPEIADVSPCLLADNPCNRGFAVQERLGLYAMEHRQR